MRRIIPALIPLLFSAAILTMAQEKAEESNFQFKPGQTVYVIAVKSRAPEDRNFWQTLNRDISREGGNSIPPQPQANNASGRITLEKSSPERATLDRAEPIRRVLPPEEPRLKKQIEEEILKQKKFTLSESPEKADFVLFANGDYVHSYFASIPGASASGVTPGSGDSEIGPTLARLSAVAISASDYHRWHGHFSELFRMAKWRDESWGRTHMRAPFEEPSVKKLIQQFHKQALKK